MSEIVLSSGGVVAPLPLPSANVTIRPATMADVPFMDSLQKTTTKQVGWMPTKQFEGKVKLGQALVAWAARPSLSETQDEEMGEPPMLREEPVGYLIGQDQYFKRDDVGIIYQMNVVPGRQRGLVGASLLRAQFERSAYGCKLYCCWCAQDIAANRFWEAMGFVPLAFRAGSEKKARVHIFWQKRIRRGDAATPWWFPSKTAGGSLREDRIVLPIPPGVKWSDDLPRLYPQLRTLSIGDCQLPNEAVAVKRVSLNRQLAIKTPRSLPAPPVRRNGLMFDIPQPGEALPEDQKPARAKKEKVAKAKRAADPRLAAAARELRDRWLEQVNAGRGEVALPAGKYEVSRAIGEGDRAGPGATTLLLPAA